MGFKNYYNESRASFYFGLRSYFIKKIKAFIDLFDVKKDELYDFEEDDDY